MVVCALVWAFKTYVPRWIDTRDQKIELTQTALIEAFREQIADHKAHSIRSEQRLIEAQREYLESITEHRNQIGEMMEEHAKALHELSISTKETAFAVSRLADKVDRR